MPRNRNRQQQPASPPPTRQELELAIQSNIDALMPLIAQHGPGDLREMARNYRATVRTPVTGLLRTEAYDYIRLLLKENMCPGEHEIEMVEFTLTNDDCREIARMFCLTDEDMNIGEDDDD